jgi:hypothetical protein
MKAGVYVHLYASLNGFEIWMWWSILRYTLNNYISHCATVYRTLDILHVGCMDIWMLVWRGCIETNTRSVPFS